MRFLKKPRDTRAKECLILRKPVMVSISPRLRRRPGSRVAGDGEDRAGGGAVKGMGPGEGGGGGEDLEWGLRERGPQGWDFR